MCYPGHAYCLHGTCRITQEGDPNCECKPGWTGEQCDHVEVTTTKGPTEKTTTPKSTTTEEKETTTEERTTEVTSRASTFRVY